MLLEFYFVFCQCVLHYIFFHSLFYELFTLWSLCALFHVSELNVERQFFQHIMYQVSVYFKNYTFYFFEVFWYFNKNSWSLHSLKCLYTFIWYIPFIAFPLLCWHLVLSVSSPSLLLSFTLLEGIYVSHTDLAWWQRRMSHCRRLNYRVLDNLLTGLSGAWTWLCHVLPMWPWANQLTYKTLFWSSKMHWTVVLTL